MSHKHFDYFIDQLIENNPPYAKKVLHMLDDLSCSDKPFDEIVCQFECYMADMPEAAQKHYYKIMKIKNIELRKRRDDAKKLKSLGFSDC